MTQLAVKLLLQRGAVSLATLLFVSVAVFAVSALLPSDMAENLLGQAVTPEAAAALREALGLDGSPVMRYLDWLGGILRGDLGMSFVANQPIAHMVAERLPNSLILAGITMAITIPLSITLGVLAALWQGRIFDRIVSAGALTLVGVPEFVLANAMVMIFAVWLGWLPALSFTSQGGSMVDLFRAFVLPVTVLVLSNCSQIIRITRASVIEILRSSYVENARLKGASNRRIVLRHALPNTVPPIVNAIALSLSSLLGGVIIIEAVFNYPGLAKLMVDAVASRDMPLVQICAMIFCAFYLVLIVFADVTAILSNPRLRKQ
ncbi:ABC transporter permease [Paracoccus nototheniae]|uniref:ABC transporter permease n=1 Tax=Paracoccus nototheniae TaxID=2489002 RepID=UPI0010395BBE|nr:ABC transporter permease [Paracoccus nototheniae]